MYLKVKGTIVAMNASRWGNRAYDVLLHVTDVDGSPQARKKLLDKNVIFEGVISGTAFFAGDEIALRYSEEFGPRNLSAEVLCPHEAFVDILPTLERPSAEV